MNWDEQTYATGMCVLIVLCALLLGTFAVRAQERHDHAALGAAGEFYAKWMIPNSGRPRVSSCCSQRDCFPAEVRYQSGRWEFMSKFSRRWTPIPEQLLEHNQPDPRESPDGLPHVCENPNSGALLCAVLGSGI